MPSMDNDDVAKSVRNVGTTYDRAYACERVNASECVSVYEDFIAALAEGRFYGDIQEAAKEIKKLF